VPRITDFCSCICVLGCKLSLVRLCDSDFGITPEDNITIGITCVAFSLPHSTYFIRQFSLLVLFVSYCFGEIMCLWDSYVYQKGDLFFLIHKSYVRSIKRYCFVRKYAAIPVQLEIFILRYIGWCVLIIWILSSINSAASASYYYYYYYYYYILQEQEIHLESYPCRPVLGPHSAFCL